MSYHGYIINNDQVQFDQCQSCCCMEINSDLQAIPGNLKFEPGSELGSFLLVHTIVVEMCTSEIKLGPACNARI